MMEEQPYLIVEDEAEVSPIVLDKRGFVVVERAVWSKVCEFGPGPLAVYVMLATHVNGRSGDAFPSVKTLAQMCKLSEPTVRTHISTLEKEGLIQVQRRKTKDGMNLSNNYILPDLREQGGYANDLGRVPKPFVTNKTNTNKTTTSPSVDPIQDGVKSTPYALVMGYFDGLEKLGRKVNRADANRHLRDGKYAVQMGMNGVDVESATVKLGKDPFYKDKPFTLRRVVDTWAVSTPARIERNAGRTFESPAAETFDPFGED